jgi:hypothetical protein
MFAVSELIAKKISDNALTKCTNNDNSEQLPRKVVLPKIADFYVINGCMLRRWGWDSNPSLPVTKELKGWIQISAVTIALR